MGSPDMQVDNSAKGECCCHDGTVVANSRCPKGRYCGNEGAYANQISPKSEINPAHRRAADPEIRRLIAMQRRISCGGLAHSLNQVRVRSTKNYAFARDYTQPTAAATKRHSLWAFRRENGRVGNAQLNRAFQYVIARPTWRGKMPTTSTKSGWRLENRRRTLITKSGLLGWKLTGERWTVRRTLYRAKSAPTLPGRGPVNWGLSANILAHFRKKKAGGRARCWARHMQHGGSRGGRAIAEGKDAVREMLDQANAVRANPVRLTYHHRDAMRTGRTGFQGAVGHRPWAWRRYSSAHRRYGILWKTP